MDARVEVIRETSRELVDAFSRLLPQLSSTAEPLDREAIGRMVACDANTVLVARTPGGIIGTLTLVLLPLPSGLRGRVEDVVVDSAARGRGVAGLLTREALRIAREAGARTVDLTSRPDRAAANRLYERLGFQARRSTVYRFPVVGDAGPAGPAPTHGVRACRQPGSNEELRGIDHHVVGDLVGEEQSLNE